MVPVGVSDDKLAVLLDIIDFLTSQENQVDMLETLSWLPALKTALEHDMIKSDPILKGSAAQDFANTPADGEKSLKTGENRRKKEGKRAPSTVGRCPWGREAGGLMRRPRRPLQLA